MTDSQQKQVYAMEDEFMLAYMRQPPVSLRYLRSVANKACRRWGVPPARVQFGNSKKFVGESFGNGVIALYVKTPRRQGRNVAVLLHELAHYIDDKKFGGVDESHGPTFVAIEMDLLEHFKVLPSDAFGLIAKRHRVKIGKIRRKTKKPTI